MAEVVRGVIEKKGEGVTPNKKAPYWTFTVGGVEHSTFNAADGNKWKVGDEVAILYEQRGKYRNITQMMLPSETPAQQSLPLAVGTSDGTARTATRVRCLEVALSWLGKGETAVNDWLDLAGDLFEWAENGACRRTKPAPAQPAEAEAGKPEVHPKVALLAATKRGNVDIADLLDWAAEQGITPSRRRGLSDLTDPEAAALSLRVEEAKSRLSPA